MKRALLVLAEDHDLHADAVYSRIKEAGYPVFRFNPEADWTKSGDSDWDYGGKISWSPHKGDRKSKLSWWNQSLCADDVGAVFCRHFEFFSPIADAMPTEHLQYAEMKAGIFGFFRLLDDRYWMNKPWLEDLIDNKIVQSDTALKLGLKVPRTIVTNDPDDAKAFIAQCANGAIIKQLSHIAINDDESVSSGFFTSVVGESDLAYLDEIEVAPCLLQENIKKKCDVRVNVVGDTVIAYEIDSQSRSESETDFRKVQDLPVSEYRLPAVVADQLRSMLTEWRIEFAACDLIHSQDDELIFLEANPSGNWLWLEQDGQDRTLEAISSVLKGQL